MPPVPCTYHFPSGDVEGAGFRLLVHGGAELCLQGLGDVVSPDVHLGADALRGQEVITALIFCSPTVATPWPAPEGPHPALGARAKPRRAPLPRRLCEAAPRCWMSLLGAPRSQRWGNICAASAGRKELSGAQHRHGRSSCCPSWVAGSCLGAATTTAPRVWCSAQPETRAVLFGAAGIYRHDFSKKENIF